MADFTFNVLVFGLPMPEYHQDGRVFIESNLFTPVTYNLRARQMVNGELREHECPVTPYQVRVSTNALCQKSLFRLYVDGVLVNWSVFGKGKNYIFKGVSGRRGTRELLFTLPPNFGKRKNDDQVDQSKVSKLGTIEVVQYEAIYRRSEYNQWKGVTLRHVDKTGTPNNSMCVNCHSREGKLIEAINSYNYFDVWDVGLELGRQCVEYCTAHCLRGMGMCLVEVDWGQAPDSASYVKNW